MPKSYYSTVFDQPAEEIWRVIRDFNNYPVWVDGAGASTIEDGKKRDAVGAVRDVLYNGERRRQRLLALSDVERMQVYTFERPAPMPVWDFQATIRVTPVIDADRAFVEWFATFDCYPEGQDERIAFFRDASPDGWNRSGGICRGRRWRHRIDKTQFVAEGIVMRFAAALVALISLASCAQYDAARQANLAAAAQAQTASDDASCRSSGAQPGTPAYDDCRKRSENQHAQEMHRQDRLANEMLTTPIGAMSR